MRMIKEVEVRILLDYLKELRELNGNGYSAHKEIAEVVKELREKFAFGKDVQTVAVPLLTIELETLDDVPKIHYKGEEVALKTLVNFHWKTAGSHREDGECGFSISHYLKDGSKLPNLTTIREEL